MTDDELTSWCCVTFTADPLKRVKWAVAKLLDERDRLAKMVYTQPVNLTEGYIPYSQGGPEPEAPKPWADEMAFFKGATGSGEKT